MKSQQRANGTALTPKREKFIGSMVIGWIMTGAIGIVLSWAFGDSLIGDAMGWVIGGAIGGLVTGYALRLVKTSFKNRQIAVLILGWAINLAFFEAIVAAIGDTLGIALSWTLGWAVAGAIGGWVTGYTLRLESPPLPKKQLTLLTLGAAIGWAVGGTMAGSMGDALSWTIGWAIVGATQGSLLLWCLNSPAFGFKA